MSYFLGIDLGTSSLKILIGDENGNILGSYSHSYEVISSNEYYSEQDPSSWINGFNIAFSSLLSQFPYLKKEHLIISFSGQMHSLVLIDNQGIPLRPAILWNDGRTFEEVAYLRKNHAEHLLNIEKNIALEGFTLPKLLWVRENEPDIWSRVYKFMMPKDYLIFYLTKTIATEPSDASGTIMYDVINNRWDQELLEDLNIDKAICPTVLGSFDSIGEMTDEIKALFDLTNTVDIVMGGADNACGALGVISDPDTQGMISVGTSGVVLSYDLDTDTSGLGTYHYFNSLNNDIHYKMGVTLSAGYSLEWFKRIVSEESNFEEFTKLAEKSPLGSRKVQYHPYLFGERSPFFNPMLSASFVYLKSFHTKEDLIRSVMEGIAFSLKNVADSMGKKKEIYRYTGGAAKNPFWIQMFADIFDSKMEVLKLDEGPAYGALLASVYHKDNQQYIDNWLAINSVETAYFPIPENVKKYKEIFSKFKITTQELNKINQVIK